MVVMGTAAGLSDDLSPGDLVVATEVTDGETTVALPGADLLAAELRRAGPDRPGGAARHRAKASQVRRTGAAGRRRLPCRRHGVGRPARRRQRASGRRHPGGVRRRVRAGHGRRGGIAALRSLRKAAPVAEKWAAACRERTVLLAGPRSFCAGVERAIEIVERALEMRGAPVYVRKQIVHNTRVVSDLEQRGAVFVDELDEVPDGATVVFSAHGVSPAVRDDASGRGPVGDRRDVPAGVEGARRGAALRPRGLHGRADRARRATRRSRARSARRPSSTVLVQTAAGRGRAVDVDDPSKIAYLMQTTLAIDEAADVAGALRDKFPQMRAPGSDDICYATTNRQAAVRAVATEADLVLVAGSANSSNSVRLVERSERDGDTRAPHRRRDRHRPVLAGRRVGGRPHGRRLGPARGRQRDHRGPVRPGHRSRSPNE